MKKGKTILIVIVVFLAIGVISGIAHNLTGTTPAPYDSNEKTSAETTLDNNKDIIWKDEDKIGILNLQLDGTKTKQGIIAEYYTETASYINNLDKNNLPDYEYVEIVGNVMNDGKIDCSIKGKLTLEQVKTTEHFSPASVESDIQELFIPKPLQ